MNSKEKLLKAIRNGELVDFLKGNLGYKIELHELVSANVPTDISAVSRTLYEIDSERPNLNIETLFEKALLNIMDGTLYDLYTALMYVFDFMISKLLNIKTIEINQKLVLEKLRKKIILNQEELKKNTVRQGDNNSIWDEVMRIDKICRDEMNIPIIMNTGS